MTILGISCSPRSDGNTEMLMGEALLGVREEGVAAELVSLAGRSISPCDGCGTCRETGECHIQDDMQAI